MARLDAAASRDRTGRTRGRRTGGRRPRARPGAPRSRWRGRVRGDAGRAAGRFRGWPAAWPRSPIEPTSRTCPRPMFRCCIRRSCAVSSVRSPTTSTSSCPRSADTASRWRPRIASACWTRSRSWSRLIGSSRRSCLSAAGSFGSSDADMLRDRALARLDPELGSVSNLNEPSDYRACARAARTRDPGRAVRHPGAAVRRAPGDGAGVDPRRGGVGGRPRAGRARDRRAQRRSDHARPAAAAGGGRHGRVHGRRCRWMTSAAAPVSRGRHVGRIERCDRLHLAAISAKR